MGKLDLWVFWLAAPTLGVTQRLSGERLVAVPCTARFGLVVKIAHSKPILALNSMRLLLLLHTHLWIGLPHKITIFTQYSAKESRGLLHRGCASSSLLLLDLYVIETVSLFIVLTKTCKTYLSQLLLNRCNLAPEKIESSSHYSKHQMYHLKMSRFIIPYHFLFLIIVNYYFVSCCNTLSC